MILAEGCKHLETWLEGTSVVSLICLATGGGNILGARAGRKCGDWMDILLQDVTVWEGVRDGVCDCRICLPKVSFGVHHQQLPKVFLPVITKDHKVSAGLGRERMDQGLAKLVLRDSVSDLDAAMWNSILYSNVNT